MEYYRAIYQPNKTITYFFEEAWVLAYDLLLTESADHAYDMLDMHHYHKTRGNSEEMPDQHLSYIIETPINRYYFVLSISH
jgi:hypothetical protein